MYSKGDKLMRYKVIQDVRCDGALHTPKKVGAKIWNTVFANINNAFLCMAEYHCEMNTNRFWSSEGVDCTCRAKVVQVS